MMSYSYVSYVWKRIILPSKSLITRKKAISTGDGWLLSTHIPL